MKPTDRTACFRRTGGLRSTRRRPLHERDALTIYRRVLSRLRAALGTCTGPEFDATARAVAELNDHRRRFHRGSCAPALEPHPGLVFATCLALR